MRLGRRSRLTATVGAVVLAIGAATMLASVGATAAPGDTIGPFNPVTEPLGQQVDGHAANSEFLVFIERDVQLNADEAEGTLALGGNLTLGSNYNVLSPRPTFTAPDDTVPVTLFVGGGMDWSGGPFTLKVLGGGYAKIADTSTYDAFNTDQNNATVNFAVVQPGQSYESPPPRIDGTSPQMPASIEAPVPADLIDIDAAYALYRESSALLGTCAPTLALVNRDDGAPLPTPFPPGTNAKLTITPGQTNVLNISTDDLARLSSITFDTQPSPNEPLLVNVFGSTYLGNIPNQAGIGEAQAPAILYNFVDATAVTVTGGDSIAGTIYAPRADLNWQVTQDIAGNVIARSFIHGTPLAVPTGDLREVHDWPFRSQLTCVEADVAPTPTPTGSPSPTPTDSPSPTPTDSPSPTPTDSPSPTPTDNPSPTPTPTDPGPTPSPSGTLPATGGPDVHGGILFGAALAAAGAILLIGSRRRDTH